LCSRDESAFWCSQSEPHPPDQSADCHTEHVCVSQLAVFVVLVFVPIRMSFPEPGMSSPGESAVSDVIVGDGGSPCRRIRAADDIDTWLHSEAYRDYLNFIKQLNEFAKRVHDTALKSRDEVVEPSLVRVVALLDHLSTLCDQIEPFNDDKNQRSVGGGSRCPAVLWRSTFRG